MARFPYVRWTIIALFVGAMVINYLARSVLGVAAPAIMAEQSISSAQYSWITGAFQFGIMFQPVAGYLLDVIGLKIGFTLFVALWSLITLGHGLATGWLGFAGLRGALRLAVAAETEELPDWPTLVVQGPTAVPGPGGRFWCRYTASVSTRPARI